MHNKTERAPTKQEIADKAVRADRAQFGEAIRVETVRENLNRNIEMQTRQLAHLIRLRDATHPLVLDMPANDLLEIAHPLNPF